MAVPPTPNTRILGVGKENRKVSIPIVRDGQAATELANAYEDCEEEMVGLIDDAHYDDDGGLN
jgi:hypothetical protein